MKNLALLAASALCFTGAAQAQDKATLDLLVSKGLITADEAQKLVEGNKPKSPLGIVQAKSSSTVKLTIGGLVQAQYQGIALDGETNTAGVVTQDKPAGTNRFELRRAQLDFDAQIGTDWSAFVSFIAENGANARDYLDKAGVTYKSDFGNLTAGFKKVNFAVEEYTSGSRLFAIERSIATNYFASGQNGRRLGFASRHVGIFWDGKIKGLDGFEYGASLTNGFQNSVASATANNNQLNGWGYVQYTAKISESVQVQFGVNIGYQPGDDTFVSGTGGDSSVFGYNPFINAKIDGATLNAEFIGAQVKNGANPDASGDTDTSPFGVNLTAAYRFGDIEPVIRYSYLQGDGRGLRSSDVWRSAPDTGRTYDEAWTIYVGANYYLYKNAIKISAGYEHARFSGSPNGATSKSTADGDGVRVQLQASF